MLQQNIGEREGSEQREVLEASSYDSLHHAYHILCLALRKA